MWSISEISKNQMSLMDNISIREMEVAKKTIKDVECAIGETGTE